MSLPPLFFNTMGRWSCGPINALYNVSGGQLGALGQFQTANRAYYVPFRLPWAYPIKRIFMVNSFSNGNIDLGIYGADGSKIFSIGSTAMAGSNAPQYMAKNILLPSGSYYFGVSGSSTGATWFAVNEGLPRTRLIGMLEEASALPLPARMTPVTPVATSIPFLGFTMTESGF